MSVIAAAQADVVENIICRRYHDPELDLTNQPLDCKSEAVQSEVALVQGWGDSLAQIPDFFPDTFSIRMVWAAPILQVIGGGRSVGALLTYTIIADVVPRAER
ncbi:hypothetical protein N7448_006545 [Penicillium atrosanguineum]|nr:hypothetical protein N7448_006545 [Penicillium atrosanguineum]KAJ5137401.1 hypothetical protein N7526_003634 [Penicillium atrosanguineum]